MVNRRICLVLLVIREIQIKTIRRDHSEPIRRAKSSENNKC